MSKEEKDAALKELSEVLDLEILMSKIITSDLENYKEICFVIYRFCFL